MIELIISLLIGFSILFLIVNYGLKRINFKNKIHKNKDKKLDSYGDFFDFGSD